MPKFIDYHEKLPPLPPEAAQAMADRIRAGRPDDFGVTGLNIFLGTDGRAYCLTEAPNADSVCKSHEAKGIPLGRGDVHEVTSLV